jgi:hypothetical protein
MLRSDLSTAMNGCHLCCSQLAKAIIQEHTETLADFAAIHVTRNNISVHPRR